VHSASTAHHRHVRGYVAVGERTALREERSLPFDRQVMGKMKRART